MLRTKASSLLSKAALLLVCLTTAFLSFAQTTILRGNVKDPSGLPLAGASVLLEGTKQGTVTDASGNFSLNVAPGNYTIVISYVGVQTQRQAVTVPAGGLTDLSYTTQNSGDLNRVVVVGSRSTAVRSATQTVAPVDVITARDMQATGQVEPTQMLNVIAPSFNSSRQTIADGTDHIDPATLRGLGPDQALVLVNGRRRYNTALLNVNGTIGRGSVGTDLNAIPASSIERIEVLRDGASSQYGSDAIGGVVNVVLKKNTKGTTVYSHFGQNYKGDGGTQQVGITQGLKLGKTGFLTLSGDFRHREPSNRVGVYQGPTYFNLPGGYTPQQFDSVMAKNLVVEQQRGFSRRNNLLLGNSKLDNGGVAANMGVPLSSNLQFFATGSANWRQGAAAGFYRYPFQTSQVNTVLYPDGFLPMINSKILDRSAMAGLEGKFGGGWNWDLSQTAGGNSFAFDITNTNNATQNNAGAAAQTAFYAGKLRFNQYTTNLNFSRDLGTAIGLKSFNLAMGAEFRVDQYRIEEGEEGSYKNYGSPNGNAIGAQVFPGFQPANAVDEKRNVYSGYVDIETDITDKFLVSGAARYEQYSDFGGNFAGKFGMRYRFADALSFRGTVSNGFRAPSMHQQYFSSIATVFVNTGSGLQPLQNATFRNNDPVTKTFGIPELEAETSMNYSVGLTSRIRGGWNFTADAYMIDIEDRIVLTGQFLKSSPVVASLLSAYPDVNSAIFFTNAVNTRTRGIDLVFSKDTKLGLGNLRATLAGNFNETEVTERKPLPSQLASDPNLGNTIFNRQEEGRLERNQPRNKFSLGVNYGIGKVTFNTRATRYGSIATLNPTNPVLDEFFSPKIVTDASIGYKFKNFATLTIGANNIGDVYPDQIQNRDFRVTRLDNTSFGRFNYSREATQFGFNGGYYYTSLILDLHNIKIKKAPKPAPVVEVPPVQPPVDTDGDGTPDATDACPTAAGPAALGGCPDGDGDGVADKDDKCPTVAGAKVFGGCPDSDGDGVEDAKDKCPNQAGVARYEGCPPPDSDGDGVADDADRCPTVAGDPTNGGCPKEVPKEIQQKVDKEAKFILFEFNSAKLKASSKGALDAIATAIKSDANLFVEIEGHTDSKGTNEYNQKLSEDRAASVRQALLERGIDEAKITSTGFGEEQPVATNDTAAGRAQNRRVVVKLRY